MLKQFAAEGFAGEKRILGSHIDSCDNHLRFDWPSGDEQTVSVAMAWSCHTNQVSSENGE